MSSLIKGTLATSLMILLTACQTIPSTNVYTAPTFPALALEDHPVDPKGFCLSSTEAAKLGIYINQLQNIVKEK